MEIQVICIPARAEGHLSQLLPQHLHLTLPLVRMQRSFNHFPLILEKNLHAHTEIPEWDQSLALLSCNGQVP